jgi:TolB protein
VSRAIAAIAATLVLAALALPARAELYIDIISSPRKLPIAIMELDGKQGKDVTNIIKDDLSLSGIFEPMDPGGFTERKDHDFDPGNWIGTGAEAVVKGTVEQTGELVVTVRLYDVVESRLIMEKKYRAGNTLLRPLSHAAANDIYEKITGQKAVFRTKIAFVSADLDGNFSLNVADWDGMRSRRLNVRARSLLSPHWAPDARNIVYTAERNRKWGIYSLDFAEMKEKPLLVIKGTSIAGDFFPDGKSLALSSSINGSTDIYILDIKKMKLKRMTRGMGIEVSPTVSPDGKRLAYVSDRAGSPQIYTMDSMGYNKSRLTFEGGYNTSPSWSPHGELIAFSGRYGGRNQIFTVWTDGTGLRMLTANGNNEEPSFSPDGRFITFTSDRDGKQTVYVMGADGSGQRRISPRGMKAFSPRWSPR